MNKLLSMVAGILLSTSGIAVAAVDTGQTDGGVLGLSTSAAAVVSNIPITTFNGNWSGTTPAGTQTGRTNRNQVESLCDGAPLTTPLFASETLQSSLSEHTLVNPFSVPGCFTFTLEFANPTTCEFNLQPNLYLGSFNPADPIQNWIGTAGLSTGIPPASMTFSASLPANATAVYVLNNVNQTDTGAVPCDYTITVTAEADIPPASVPALPRSMLAALVLLLGLIGIVGFRRSSLS